MFIFSRVQVIYFTLLFIHYSESHFLRAIMFRRPVECIVYYSKGFCTREYFPVCATNGRTYFNKCTFCLAYRESGGSFTMSHYGRC
ncbi:similar to vitellogenin-like 1 precursor (predicted) [Rattus norvegicus]|uniref:Similar to vitellogenin-like 1 precursor n=2 Tax=Rattus norvegicus TaxID=10116 RepID=D3ZIT9_RAT|nr:vitellogenin-like 1 [Rattus norvegicus]XP_032745429.1 ovomucoid-like [Rattus rattus]EDL84755.1 similar to vitellogenin-like 1 precursor (predicted) [Rattus norvegicus]|eukprot:NP_001182413.1 vitellogenin-like 1 [Rattus norvegicus]